MCLLRFSLLLVFLLAPACRQERPPYPADEALDTFQLPEGFHIELVAAEPEVMDPVAMDFDAQGRLFVAELPDYPMGEKTGRIKLLEDGDGDGRFERSTVFAAGIPFPNGVMAWKQGILVTAAPDILYLEDTDGDRRADLRRIVLTGFAATNPQLRLNGLKYGLDNWIYAAYPKSGTPNRYAREFGDLGSKIRFPDHPQVAPLDMFGRGMDLRFRPGEARLEPVAGNSQFGNAFDRWGNRFTVWHNNHVRHVVLQNHYLQRNPDLAVDSAMQFLSDHGNAAKLFPITQKPLHIHESEIGHFTSSCGISVYEGGAFPHHYAGSFFVCDPVHNLVHRDLLVPSGATFVARRAHPESEFLASTDSWFRPVFTMVGPDGALYVVDFYRQIVEHPEWMPLDMMESADFYAGTERGRIYRIFHGSRRSSSPELGAAPALQLVKYLSHPNLWWRINAQRLLVERGDQSVVTPLRQLVRNAPSPEGRLHALWTLEGLRALDEDQVLAALGDPSAGVRENAVRLAERYLSSPPIVEKLLSLLRDPDPRVKFQLACTLGELVAGEAASKPANQQTKRVFRVLEEILFQHVDDAWFQVAVLSSSAGSAFRWYEAALPRKGAGLESSQAREEFLRRVASVIGARARVGEITQVFQSLLRYGEEAAGWRAAVLEGLTEGLQRISKGRLSWPAANRELLVRLLELPRLRRPALRLAFRVELEPSAHLLRLIREAAAVVVDENAEMAVRVDALGILGLDPSGATLPVLEGFLGPQHPEALQMAAAEALVNRTRPGTETFLLNRWKSFTGKTREVVLAGFFRGGERLRLLLDAIQDGRVQPWSLSASRRAQLLRFRDEEIRNRAERLFGDLAGESRQAVLQRYAPAARRKGSAERGREVFQKHCGQCHRVGGQGVEVGPDLVSVSHRSKDDLLSQILDPNSFIAAGYEEYLVETTGGELVTGVVARESATSITLRRSQGEEDTIPRQNIAALRALNVSQMPEDLEQAISLEEMTDLLQYLKSLAIQTDN